MNDVLLESLRAVLLLGIVLYLWRERRKRTYFCQKNWNLILGGFLLLLIGSLFDITDEFEELNYLVIVGDTEAEAFIEKIIGALGGFLLLAIGLVRLIPTVADIEEVKQLSVELQKRNEEIEKANHLKMEFLNMVSHELRTPLSVVLGNVPLLTHIETLPESEEIVEIARDIEEDGKHLLTLINDLLDFSKIEAGKLSIQIETVIADVMILDECAFMKKSAESKGLEVVFETERVSVRADPVRLKQILINLIGNAIKFTEEGQIKVSIRSNGKHGVFMVEDSGCGIPSENLDTVFDVFQQVDSSPTRQAGGTGLGLAISKKLVEMQGGEIHVLSMEEAGSTFIFTLPLFESVCFPSEGELVN